MSDEERKRLDCERHKEDYAFWKSKGICVCCHQENAVKGKTRCALCADIHNEYSANYIHRTNYHTEHADERHEKRKKQREERIANGICVRCGKRKARDGMKTCEICCKKEYRQRLTRMITRGYDTREMRECGNRCVHCGAEERYNGTKLCVNCYNKAIEAQRKAVVASVESGNNIYCNGAIGQQVDKWWTQWKS